MPATEAWPYARASCRLAQTDSKVPDPLVATYVACAQMQPAPASDPPSVTRARPPLLARSWRLGIGWRLGLGLAAVAGVLIVAEDISTRTTREAVQAVRGMQEANEPIASSANAVLERLVAYDGSVVEYIEARNGADFKTITAAGDALEQAMAAYYG